MSESPSNKTWGSFNVASQTKDLLVQLIKNVIQQERPGPIHAVVESVDWSLNRAMVVYQGDTEAVPVSITSVYPRVGQSVVVDGLPGDRHITEVLGNPLGIGDDIYVWSPGGPQNYNEGSPRSGDVFNVYIPTVWPSYNVDLLFEVPYPGTFSGNMCMLATRWEEEMVDGVALGSGVTVQPLTPLDTTYYGFKRIRLFSNLIDFGARTFLVGRDIGNPLDVWAGDITQYALIISRS